MTRILFVLRWLLALSFITPGFSFAKDISVKGYFRSNGTYVSPHYRSSPDGNVFNNWSTEGNINPYTGAIGTKSPTSFSESLPVPLLQSDNEITNTEQLDASKLTGEPIVTLMKRANQGDAEAQNRLGANYAYGLGVPKDAEQAVKWYLKAAINGNARAQLNLGEMYASGEGVPKNFAKAAKWYQKAAAQGSASAQVVLGYMYEIGSGVQKDATKSAEWYQKAAVQKDVAAQIELGFTYLLGTGVPTNREIAVKWFQQAAAQGSTNAQLILSTSYAYGDGVPKDMVLAYAWYNLGAMNAKDAETIKKRGWFEKQLTDEDRREALALSSNWRIGEVLNHKQPSYSKSGDDITTSDDYKIAVWLNTHPNKEAVKKVLGEPVSVEFSSVFETWRYSTKLFDQYIDFDSSSGYLSSFHWSIVKNKM